VRQVLELGFVDANGERRDDSGGVNMMVLRLPMLKCMV
jgi:hypothetical protein